MSEACEKVFRDGVPLRGSGEHEAWIAHARLAAWRIAFEKGAVTIDDVREVCPPPEDADPRIMGAVFHGGEFVRVGFEVSARRACHGRMIGLFRLKAKA